MTNIPRVGIIGPGNIGRELHRKLSEEEKWNVECVVDFDGVFSDIGKEKRIGDLGRYLDFAKDMDLMFLCIPTPDNGEKESQFIRGLFQYAVPVVTSAKGALANYYGGLEEGIKNNRLGYSATVGGGSRLLEFLRSRRGNHIKEIHGIVNGTLNFIFDGLANGESLGTLVYEAKKLGYAEPGAKTPLEVINGEATGDVPKKAAILFNTANFVPQRIRARDIETQTIREEQLREVLSHAANRRYIVSITHGNYKEENVIWGFKYNVDGWCLSAGFKHVDDNPLYKKLLTAGVDNALLISEGEYGKDGTYVLKGPGAGPGPTTNSMIIDAKNILGIAR